MPGGILTYYVLSALLAFIPALVWLSFLFKKTKKKGVQIMIFLLGTFSVSLVFALQFFLKKFPQFDIFKILEAKAGGNPTVALMIVFIGVGITEEIVKQTFVRLADRRYLLIETINDSIQFSLVSALGFAFAENIFYIFSIWTNLGIKQLIVAFAFRSIFTTCAHLIFSGFFGYYYGIAKFSLNIREQSKWIGKRQITTDIIAKLTGMPRSEALKEQMILKGLFIAMAIHAFYDFVLQLNQIIIAVIFVVCGYFILQQLLKSKAGRMIMVTDVTEQRTSSMAKTDEEVVIELVGMWFKDKRYVDVLHICQRILARDPDNKIVQLFKAQALDKMDESNPFNKVLTKLFPTSKEKQTLEKLMKEKSEQPQQAPPAPILTPTEVAPTPQAEPPKPEAQTFTLNNL